MSFALYLIGFILFIAGLAWLAVVMGVGQTYIMIGAVILLGIGIFTAATRTRPEYRPARRGAAGVIVRRNKGAYSPRPMRSPRAVADQRNAR